MPPDPDPDPVISIETTYWNPTAMGYAHLRPPSHRLGAAPARAAPARAAPARAAPARAPAPVRSPASLDRAATGGAASSDQPVIVKRAREADDAGDMLAKRQRTARSSRSSPRRKGLRWPAMTARSRPLVSTEDLIEQGILPPLPPREGLATFDAVLARVRAKCDWRDAAVQKLKELKQKGAQE